MTTTRGAHAAHELGSFDLALAVSVFFAVGAIRPGIVGRSWPGHVVDHLRLGLAGTAIADLIGGQTISADEAQHLIAVLRRDLPAVLAGTDPPLPEGGVHAAVAGRRVSGDPSGAARADVGIRGRKIPGGTPLAVVPPLVLARRRRAHGR